MTFEYSDRHKPTLSEALYWDGSDDTTARIISALTATGVAVTYVAPVKEVILRNVLVRKGAPANLKIVGSAGTALAIPGDFIVQLCPGHWYPLSAEAYEELYTERWAQYVPVDEDGQDDVVLDLTYGEAYERVQTALADAWNAGAVDSTTLHILAEYVLLSLTSGAGE